MNATVVLADLDTARERVLRALERAATLGSALADCDRIAADLRDASHLLDRAINEVRFG